VDVSADEARRAEALKFLALARQADPDQATAATYLLALRDLDAELLQQACYELANEPRPDYGSALPDVGTIRARVSSVARQRRESERQAKVLQLPASHTADDEPRFFCTSCYDEPSGWQIVWCTGEGEQRQSDPSARALSTRIAPCGRRSKAGRVHAPHTYAEKCPCVETNPVIAKHRQRQAEYAARKAAR
jgi:hypothetical protein